MAGRVSLSMLMVPEKKTTPLDLYRPLRKYIVSQYSEREAQKLEDDLQAVRRMRSELEKLQTPELPPEARRDFLQEYYRALCAIESRFPISADRDHVNSVYFAWYDAFSPNRKASLQSVHLEKAAVLFNLGAVHSKIALAADRRSAAGLKQACNSFQAAAGVFQFLRDYVSLKTSLGSSATADVSAECAAALERLMLGQAQECFFEKVVSDAKAPALCAKIARQVGLYYEEACAALNSPPLNQHVDRMWISHAQVKAAYFYAEACYLSGVDLHERDEIAEEIARLRSGIGALTDCKKSTRAPASLLDAINDLEGALNLSLERAVKENDRVYLMRVPPISSLSPLSHASLVKPSPMADILDPTMEKLFASLVPDGSAKALCKYTDAVDEIIRAQVEKLERGSEIARIKIKEMSLPESLLAFEGRFVLPAEIKEEVEAVIAGGGPAALSADLQELRDLRKVNQAMLMQTEQILLKEERQDADFRSRFGKRWTRPQSTFLSKNLYDCLQKFAANLKQAADSDELIERSIDESSELMAILYHKPIESALPSFGGGILSLDKNKSAIVGTLKQSLIELETIGSQRASLEDMLKEMKTKDDILPKLISSSAGSYDDLFKTEIMKYDEICHEISQNIEAQDRLLLQIQEQNNDFAKVFNLDEHKASCGKCCQQIAAAVAKVKEIKQNINEGMNFYLTLQEAISNAKQQCGDFALTRSIECQEIIAGLKIQMEDLSISSKKPGR